MLKRFLRSRRAVSAPPSRLPDGERVYAIGDIHGRLDLFDEIFDRIEADDAQRGTALTTLIFLGDLVDRGPESAGVIERLLRLTRERSGMRFLLGNHEEVFLLALDGDEHAIRLFCRIGGRETATSYGIAPADYETLNYAELNAALTQAVPQSHRTFIESFEDMIVMGDYAFVHAGIRPGTPLDQQRAADLRWIREPFLDHRGPLDKVIVHGHTIRPEIEILPHRIGIDTGGYATNRLSAIGLEGAERWTIQTSPGLLGGLGSAG